MTAQQDDERRKYHHDPEQGETRAPDGENPGADGADPHDPLNAPVEETPPVVPEKQPEPGGMGGRPPARGERVSSRPMPDEDE